MGFAFKTAYVGPYAVTMAKAKAGSIQKFRYKIPVSKDFMAQGTFVLEGRILASWSGSSSLDQEYSVGGSLASDRVFQNKPLTLNEDLTLTALEDSAYLCTGAVGIEQKVHLERHHLSAGQEITIPRYDLLLVGGVDSSVSVNGGEAKKGLRIVYARTTELVVAVESASVMGVLSFLG